MYQVIENSLHQLNRKKAPLNRLIRAAKQADAQSVLEANLPTLHILRNTLLSGLAPDELEMATGSGRRFRDLLERTTSRVA
jgi:hypothetical protein